MKTQDRRRRHRRHADLGQRTSPEEMYHDYPGEYAHRYSENISGDPYDIYGENVHRFRNWDDNPGGGSYGYEDYPRRENQNQAVEPYRRERERGYGFRSHNTRFRNHLRRYRRRRDYHFDIDRENLYRESGSIDEHLSGALQGFRNW